MQSVIDDLRFDAEFVQDLGTVPTNYIEEWKKICEKCLIDPKWTRLVYGSLISPGLPREDTNFLQEYISHSLKIINAFLLERKNTY